MANVKITELTAATALAGTDVLPIVDVGADATKKVSVSDLLRNLPDGTSSAPALAFADDQNTGLLSPGNNSLAFATSGTQRLVIDSSGNCGIGTTSPSAKLHANSGTTDVVADFESGDANAWIQIRDNSTTDTAVMVGAVGDDMRLRAGSNERVRIDSSGKVGIGTTSPAGGLHVDAASGVDGPIFDSGGTGNTNHALLVRDSGNNQLLRVNNNGNVGIGTTAPSTPLHVKGGGDCYVTLQAGVTDGNAGLLIDNSAGTQKGFILYDTDDNNLTFGTGDSERMRIDSDGRLLVGTSSEVSDSSHAKVQITASAGGTLVLGRDDSSVTSGNGIGLIRFYGNDGGSYQECARIEVSADGTHANNDKPTRMEFHTTADNASSPTERMRIDSSGNVGIGVTSPQQRQHLHIDSSAACLTQYTNSVTGSGAADGLLVGLDSTEDGLFWIRESKNLTFGTANTERMRIDSSGNVGVGTSAPAELLTVNGTDKSAMIRTSNSTGTAKLKLNADDINFAGVGLENTALVFRCSNSSSPTARMRITNNGITSVFSSNQGFNSRITAGSSANQEIFLGRHSATDTTNGTLCFFVEADGDVKNTNNSYGAISDIKLKENIVDASSQWSDIKSLQIRNYNFKSETNQPTHTQLGLIAQEVELVSPGLVSESTDRDGEGNDLGTTTKSVNYSVLYMKAVKALQEAMDRIETLETKVAALEAQ